jgi:DNA-binding NtrC family response regulator
MVPNRATPTLFERGERAFARATAVAAFGNPFGPAPAVAQRAALGSDYVDVGPVWIPRSGRAGPRENRRRLYARLEPLVYRLRERLAGGLAVSASDLVLYYELCFFHLQGRYEDRLLALACGSDEQARLGRVDFYDDFAADHAHLGGVSGVGAKPPAHLFACAYQIQRALHHIGSTLLGESPPVARLRAEVWESIFTCDLRRYLRTVYARMDELPTLVLGESGTGKERVARAIGLSRYVPFDATRSSFVADPAQGFHAVNLSALSRTVLESELFGHKRGAFTGAHADKTGWLELDGTVLLDEIGEIEGDVQVLLLRVLQERTFHRVGDTAERKVRAKIIAATHRDLEARVREGTFRLDLYMRLCTDRLRTPSLRALLDAAPGERRALVHHVAESVAGPDEADDLTAEVEAWIDAELPPDYAWPGNVRELEQYVKSRLIHGSFRPLALALEPEPAPVAEADPEARPDAEAGGAHGETEEALPADAEQAAFLRDFREGNLSVADLVARYMTHVQAQTGSYRKTARRLAVDRRLVARTIDHALLARLVGKSRSDADDDDND